MIRMERTATVAELADEFTRASRLGQPIARPEYETIKPECSIEGCFNLVGVAIIDYGELAFACLKHWAELQALGVIDTESLDDGEVLDPLKFLNEEMQKVRHAADRRDFPGEGSVT